MNRIDTITGDANQVTKLVLDDGTVAQLTLNYRGAIQRWSFDVVHPLLTVRGLNLCVQPNLLRSWREIIPFGIGCTTTDGADPVYVDDFTSGRATLHLLDAADVKTVEATIFGAGT